MCENITILDLLNRVRDTLKKENVSLWLSPYRDVSGEPSDVHLQVGGRVQSRNFDRCPLGRIRMLSRMLIKKKHLESQLQTKRFLFSGTSSSP